jgi:hypothetical protein
VLALSYFLATNGLHVVAAAGTVADKEVAVDMAVAAAAAVIVALATVVATEQRDRTWRHLI